MKAAVALTVALLSAAAAQAAVTETVNGLTYSIQYFDADGSELPVELGPASFPRGRRDETDPEASSSSSSSPRGRRAALLQQRSQTFENWCGAANLHPPRQRHLVPRLRQVDRAHHPPPPRPDPLLPARAPPGRQHRRRRLPPARFHPRRRLRRLPVRRHRQRRHFLPDWPRRKTGKLLVCRLLARTLAEHPDPGQRRRRDARHRHLRLAHHRQRHHHKHHHRRLRAGRVLGLPASPLRILRQWIVSAVGSGSSGKHDPLADFTDTCFRECKAATSGGKSAGPGTNNINLMQRGRFLCTGRIDGSNVHLHSSN